MILIVRYSILFFGTLLFWSCNNAANSTKANRTEKGETNKNYLYRIEKDAISLEWTAYKFTDRIAVSGTFDKYNINTKINSGPIEKILTKLEFSIPTNRVDAQNAIRDFKLRSSFFTSFNTPSIDASIIKVKDGEGTVRVKMNTIFQNVPFTYSVKNDTIVIFSNFDLKRWKAEEAITRIENECAAHLKGNDGISKLWPIVDVVVKLPLNSIEQLD